MLSDKMEKAMNDQINAEMYSSYLYMSMAAWFDQKQLPGFAHWMKIQAQEEMTHVIRFYHHVYERGGKVTLAAIDGPETEWPSPLSVFEQVASHEAHVTSLINNLVTLARSENDYASENFLQWFVAEQVEEEASADEVVGKLKLVGDQGEGVYLVDQEMAGRAFTMPPDITF